MACVAEWIFGDSGKLPCKSSDDREFVGVMTKKSKQKCENEKERWLMEDKEEAESMSHFREFQPVSEKEYSPLGTYRTLGYLGHPREKHHFGSA